MAKTKIGLDAKLYFMAAGVSGSGVWTELANVRDVNLVLEKDEADISSREANGWEATRATLKKGSIEFDMNWKPSDAGFAAIKDAYFNDSHIGIRALDAAADDPEGPGEGLEADFEVTQFRRNEPLKEAITVAVTLKVTYVDTAPTWIGGS